MTTAPFTRDPYLYAFLGAIAIWIVSDLSIGARYQRRLETNQDRGSKRAIGAAVSGGVLSAAFLQIAIPSLTVPVPTVAFWIGIGLMLLGIVVRQYAVRTLGANFSLEVSVSESDTVITSGPYRWVRHPSYTGGFLTLVGIGIATAHWLSIGITVVAGLGGYGYRIRVEEQALRDKLGDRYEAYTRQTPSRLLPFVW